MPYDARASSAPLHWYLLVPMCLQNYPGCHGCCCNPCSPGHLHSSLGFSVHYATMPWWLLPTECPRWGMTSATPLGTIFGLCSLGPFTPTPWFQKILCFRFETPGLALWFYFHLWEVDNTNYSLCLRRSLGTLLKDRLLNCWGREHWTNTHMLCVESLIWLTIILVGNVFLS